MGEGREGPLTIRIQVIETYFPTVRVILQSDQLLSLWMRF